MWDPGNVTLAVGAGAPFNRVLFHTPPQPGGLALTLPLTDGAEVADLGWTPDSAYLAAVCTDGRVAVLSRLGTALTLVATEALALGPVPSATALSPRPGTPGSVMQRLLRKESAYANGAHAAGGPPAQLLPLALGDARRGRPAAYRLAMHPSQPAWAVTDGFAVCAHAWPTVAGVPLLQPRRPGRRRFSVLSSGSAEGLSPGDGLASPDSLTRCPSAPDGLSAAVAAFCRDLRDVAWYAQGYPQRAAAVAHDHISRIVEALAGAVNALDPLAPPEQCADHFRTLCAALQWAEDMLNGLVAHGLAHALTPDGLAVPAVGLGSHWAQLLSKLVAVLTARTLSPETRARLKCLLRIARGKFSAAPRLTPPPSPATKGDLLPLAQCHLLYLQGDLPKAAVAYRRLLPATALPLFVTLVLCGDVPEVVRLAMQQLRLFRLEPSRTAGEAEGADTYVVTPTSPGMVQGLSPLVLGMATLAAHVLKGQPCYIRAPPFCQPSAPRGAPSAAPALPVVLEEGVLLRRPCPSLCSSPCPCPCPSPSP